MIAVRCKVTGVVQGVGFRWHTVHQAQLRGVAGWVRNRSDGTVEIHVEGSSEAVDEFLTAVAEGPPGARVDHVARTPASPTGKPGFSIVR